MIAVTTSATLPTLRGKTVLVVDDHADTLGLLAWTFRSLGATTLTAANVGDAQREIITHRPNLIVSDIALPGESGLDLVAWLRGTTRALGRDTPCIGITAYPSTFPPSVAQGFTAYMRKPLDIGHLCSLAVGLLNPA
jgi:CheY-like chemotaxis protein